MAYLVIEDFRAGLDRRKMEAASVPGSLQVLTNAHITRGGEIEKRKAMVAKYSLPSTVFGLAGANGVIYTFGSVLSPAVPTGVTYQRLIHSTGQAMSSIVDTEFFNGLTWVSALYANGSVQNFYNAVRITDFDSGSGAVSVAGAVVTSALTVKDKMYVTSTSIAHFSGIDMPGNAGWQAAGTTGEGFKNMANQSAGSELLTGMGRYQDLTAVFSRRNIQLWYFDPDPVQNVQRQVLSNIGSFAKRSIVPFGENDVFFLADSGVRSLRARSNSDRGGVSDVGTPVDPELTEYMATLTAAQKAEAVATIEPVDGRYILAIGDRNYVFSYYSDAKISAWSRYDFGFSVSDYVSDDGKLWARGGNTVYLYGGDTGTTYDSSTVTVELPYLDGRQVATFKQFTGFDIICEGQWTVQINTDPLQPTVWETIAIVTGTTLALQGAGMQAHSPLIKFKLTNAAAGAAKISKIIAHYVSAEAT